MIIMIGGTYMKECKIILAVILLSVVLICSSCNKGTNQRKTTVANNISYAYDKEATISTENEKIVFSENGYYFIANANLYFYDMYNDITLPLCSKLYCNHVDSSCDSYISDTSLYVDEQGTIQSDGNSICLASTIWYDDGKLYMVQREDSGDYLMQYDKDYTNQVKLCQLALAGEETGAADPRPTAQMKMYNGYIYYFVTGYFEVPDMVDKDYMATIKCKRIKVEKGAQAETLGEFEFSADYTGFGASKANIAIGKDSIYFMICSQGRLLSDINPIRLKIFRYDIGDNDFKTVYEKESDDSNEFLGEGTGSFKYPICHNSCVDNDDFTAPFSSST